MDVNGGGAGSQGSGGVILDGVNVRINNTNVNGGGVLELNGGLASGRGVVVTRNAPSELVIDTIAGGLYGDGNVGTKATLVTPIVAAADPLGRGLYFVDVVPNAPALLRFLNTTRNPVTIAGVKIAGGTVKTIAGGGLDLNDNVAALQADLGIVSGLAVKPGTGDIIYFIDKGGALVRFINISDGWLS